MRVLSKLPVLALAACALAGCDKGTLPFLGKGNGAAMPVAQAAGQQDRAIADPPAPAPGQFGKAPAAQQAAQQPQPAPLTGIDYVISRVKRGDFLCAGAVTINVSDAADNPREFVIKSKGFEFRMVPVVTASGAVRLENEAKGVIWLQVANRAMLMNQKKGQRMAAECLAKT
ncbi:hypothetical protein [Vandammella animalimorsus]|uniref:hypothetical protein n=1 Tax=Vandammella animalimorsus TaxID=2029117 RepID=UPI0011785586|nr:hypothetical protein [Vandammella animalimorsus]